MSKELSPAIYGPVDRFNAHFYWAEHGTRIWNESVRHLGHEMIDAYPLVVSGLTPTFLESAAYTPGDFAAELLADEAGDDIVENIAALGFGTYDYESDWQPYWSAVSDALTTHQPLTTQNIDTLHDMWERRHQTAYDTKQAEDFIHKADQWTAGFIEGTRRLINEGSLPISQATFAARLRHPAEIGYSPSYVHRLNFLLRGETAGYVPNGAASDHSYGVLFNTDYPDNPDIERSRFIHELCHFYLDGLLSRDTVLTSGDRKPLDVHVGMWESPISCSPRENELEYVQNNGPSRHMELNEGGTEYITAEIHRIVPELGRFASRGLYIGWQGIWRQMERDGVDLQPFLGYKVTDQGYDMATLNHRLRWYGAMVEEFERMYVPRTHHHDVEYGWPALDQAVAALTKQSDIYDENVAPFTGLLRKPGRLLRLAEGLGHARGMQQHLHRQRQALLRPPVS